jgi:hypothetical protein
MVTLKGSMSTEGETLQFSVLPYRCSMCPFWCACLGCCAAEFGSFGGTYESPCIAALILNLGTRKKPLHFLQRIKRLLCLWIFCYLQTLLAHVSKAVHYSGIFSFLLNQLNHQGSSMFTNLYLKIYLSVSLMSRKWKERNSVDVNMHNPEAAMTWDSLHSATLKAPFVTSHTLIRESREADCSFAL